jgi:zinc-ribbon domain
LDFLLSLLILFAALAALAYPLYRASAQRVNVTPTTLDDLLAGRDGVYATLRDLETDRELGKLDEQDYNALREKYMMRASDILREIDLLEGKGRTAEASAEIEKQVAVLRAQTTDDRRKRSESRSQKAEGKQQTADLRCGNCGRPYQAGDKFCARCGREL